MLSRFNEDDWLETQLSHNGHGHLLWANLCDVVLVDTLSFRVDVACLIRTVAVARTLHIHGGPTPPGHYIHMEQLERGSLYPSVAGPRKYASPTVPGYSYYCTVVGITQVRLGPEKIASTNIKQIYQKSFPDLKRLAAMRL